MKGITPDLIEETARRLEALTPGAKPVWGKLTAEELVPHLIGTVRSSMSQIPGPAFMGNWVTTTLLPPIVFLGLVGPPKNLKSIDPETGKPGAAVSSPGGIDTLESVMHAFLEGEETGGFEASIHPLFGNIGATGWSKIHVLHTRHHLKQFRL